MTAEENEFVVEVFDDPTAAEDTAILKLGLDDFQPSSDEYIVGRIRAQWRTSRPDRV